MDFPTATTHSPMAALLRWQRVDLVLRNTSNTFARAHPLAILGGLLMGAVPPALKPENRPRRFLFRVRQPVADRVYQGREYPVTVLLPDATGEETAALVAALSRPLRNFELLKCAAPVVRTLADLLAENPLPEGADEVCLDYLTPLSFEPENAERPWEISAARWVALATTRLRTLFGEASVPGAAAFAGDLGVLAHYWHKETVGAKSSRSEGQWYSFGNAGPLYLRGALGPVWPLILLAQEFPLGDAKIGGGALRLAWHHSAFGAALGNPQTYLNAQADLAERTDVQEEFVHALREPETVARELAQAAARGAWESAPARGFRLKKENGGERLIAVLLPREYVLHKALHGLLSPWLDRVFEPASVGYRPGVAPEAVRTRIREAYRAGRIWALRADIEEFFDQVDWAILMEKLRQVIPRADAALLALLASLVRAPLELNGVPWPRVRGLVQGSPLSPLLANLYLDGFDEEMTRRGLSHVRFADDLLVLCPTEDEARAARGVLTEILAPLGLWLNESKTAILPVDAGFQFLGTTHGGGLDAAAVAEARARRTLYVRDYRAWVGVDHDALVVRTGTELLARVPFRRRDGVVLLGAGGISARAVDRMDDWKLPLVFCSGGGRPINALAPRGREHFATAAAHAARHAALGEAGWLGVARRLVRAKLLNHCAWLAELPGAPARATERIFEQALAALPAVATVDALRGHEGIAARAMFRFVNDRADPAWHSPAREPHTRADPWNSLLDFSSHLLFSRLLVFLLQRGLDPWRGFLHSADSRYESLVCDLQEPFRARLERFVLKLVNRRVIQPADFEPHPRGGVRLGGEATARFLEHWERELVTRYSGDPAHLLDLLEAQVLTVRGWVLKDVELGIYQARMRSHAKEAMPAPPQVADPATPSAAETSGETPSPQEETGEDSGNGPLSS